MSYHAEENIDLITTCQYRLTAGGEIRLEKNVESQAKKHEKEFVLKKKCRARLGNTSVFSSIQVVSAENSFCMFMNCMYPFH